VTPCISIKGIKNFLPVVFIGMGSGTIYLAGTVCLVLKGPYVALIEIGWLLCNTVNLSIDSGVPVDVVPGPPGSGINASGIAKGLLDDPG